MGWKSLRRSGRRTAPIGNAVVGLTWHWPNYSSPAYSHGWAIPVSSIPCVCAVYSVFASHLRFQWRSSKVSGDTFVHHSLCYFSSIIDAHPHVDLLRVRNCFRVELGSVESLRLISIGCEWHRHKLYLVESRFGRRWYCRKLLPRLVFFPLPPPFTIWAKPLLQAAWACFHAPICLHVVSFYSALPVFPFTSGIDGNARTWSCLILCRPVFILSLMVVVLHLHYLVVPYQELSDFSHGRKSEFLIRSGSSNRA